MKILLTGANGFLGSKVYSILKNSAHEIIQFRSSQFDLRDELEVKKLFNKHNPEIVVNMAARLGGIGDNRTNPANYFEDNR